MRTHVDLFSGIGGFALACRWLGIETIGFSEIDSYACKVLAKNFPGVPNYGDVRNVPTLACDLITGGFPCQPFSCAGKRKGADDNRFLWPAMLDVIARCRPAWVLGENVPGLIGMELDRVCADLESIGFRVQPIVIPACAVGAGHRRMRVWIVAHLNGGRKLQREGSQQDECGWPRDQAEETDSNPTSPRCDDAGQHGSGRALLPARSKQLGGGDVADVTGQRLEKRESERGNNGQELPTAWRNLWPVTVETDFSLLREVYGLSRRMDRNRRARIKTLGNSIVPQIAFRILKAMITADGDECGVVWP